MDVRARFGQRQEMNSLAQRLAHVYWIGGSPCSGKSSIVTWLQERTNLTCYSCDDAFWRHAQEIDRDRAPTLYKVTHLTWEALWMRPVETLLQDAIQVYGEEWSLIVNDLLALPADHPTVAEGAALMPDLVQDVLAHANQAIWVVPSEAFQRAVYPKRGDWVNEILSQCSQPEQALRNWMDRDAAFARHVNARARALGLRVLTVDGERAIEENAAVVGEQFGLPGSR
jgi:2-phosphoglycerate kinase